MKLNYNAVLVDNNSLISAALFNYFLQNNIKIVEIFPSVNKVVYTYKLDLVIINFMYYSHIKLIDLVKRINTVPYDKILILTNVCTNSPDLKSKAFEGLRFVCKHALINKTHSKHTLDKNRYTFNNLCNSECPEYHDNKIKKSNSLTMREVEVLELIKRGLTSKIISEVLFISKKTVDFHRRNIIKKLNIKDFSEIKYSTNYLL